jgi:hypothetical protein
MTNINNLSYKDYITVGLEGLSKNFTVKTYKLAGQEEWMGFERGRDVRVQIQWKGACIWEWILEKAFWIQRNTNKEDRVWMRKHADTKLNACKNAMVKKKPITKKKISKLSKIKVGQTQDNFEKMKRNKP